MELEAAAVGVRRGAGAGAAVRAGARRPYPLPLVPAPEDGAAALVWDCGAWSGPSSRTCAAACPAGVVAARFHRGSGRRRGRRRRRPPGDGPAWTSWPCRGGVFANALLPALTGARAARGRFRGAAAPQGPAERRRAGARARWSSARGDPGRPATTPRRRERLSEDVPCAWPFPARSSRSRSGTRRGWRRSTSAASSRRSAWRTCPTSRSATTRSSTSGFALQRLDEESALETLALFESLGLLDEEFGDAWGRPRREAGRSRRPRRSRRRRPGRRLVKYLDEFSDPELARRLLDDIRARHHAALGDHGGLRRADALDHPARHRPAAARADRADPRAGLPGLRHPAGDHRQGAGDRLAGPR